MARPCSYWRMSSAHAVNSIKVRAEITAFKEFLNFIISRDRGLICTNKEVWPDLVLIGVCLWPTPIPKTFQQEILVSFVRCGPRPCEMWPNLIIIDAYLRSI